MNAAAVPIVCIGGTLCDGRLFNGLLDNLDRAATIWNPTEVSDVGDGADALLNAIPGKFVAVGFSLGGFVALEALRRCPERVLAVVLISGNAFPDNPANAEGRLRDVELGREIGLAQFMQDRSDRHAPADAANRNAIVATIAAMADALGDDVHARQAVMNNNRPDLRSVVRNSASPILAIAGTQDRHCPQERYDDLAKAGPVRLEWIEGAGHYLPLEAPEQCAKLINAFLEGCDL